MKPTLREKDKQNITGQTDEVDLADLLFRLVKLIGRHRLLIFLITLTSVSLALVHHYSKAALYESRLVCNTDKLEYSETEHIIQVFNQYLHERNFKKLKLSPDQSDLLDAIHQINLEIPRIRYSSKSFTLLVIVKDPAVIPDVQSLIMTFINEGAYIHTIIDIESQRLKQQIELLQEEETNISQMITSMRNQMTQAKSDQVEQLADLSKLLVELKKERVTLETELLSLSPVKVIQDMAIPLSVMNKNLMVTIGIGVLAGLGLSFFLITILELSKFYREYPGRSGKVKKLSLENSDYTESKNSGN